MLTDARAHIGFATTLDIFIDKSWRAHIECDGVIVPPLWLDDETSPALNQRIQTIRQKFYKLDGQSEEFTPSTRLFDYDRVVMAIGVELGEILFGRPERRNKLHDTLSRLYERQVRSDNTQGENYVYSRVLVSLCFEDFAMEALPWEMAVWRRGGRSVILGTDRRLALVRRMMACDYTTDPPTPARIPPVRVLHLSSTSGEGRAGWTEYKAIEALLGETAQDNELDVHALPSLDSWDSDEVVHLFHFYGHSSQAGPIAHVGHVDDEPREEMQLTTERMLQWINRDKAPLLCVLLGCNTFDPSGINQRSPAWQCLQFGVEAAIGAIGKPYQGFGYYFVETLYKELPKLGIAGALQEVRRYKRAFSAKNRQDDHPDNDWYRFALLVRNLHSLDALAPLHQRAIHDQQQPSADTLQHLHRAAVPAATAESAPMKHHADMLAEAIDEQYQRAQDAEDPAAIPQLESKALRINLQNSSNVHSPSGIDAHAAAVFKKQVTATHYHLRWSALLQALSEGTLIEFPAEDK